MKKYLLHLSFSLRKIQTIFPLREKGYFMNAIKARLKTYVSLKIENCSFIDLTQTFEVEIYGPNKRTLHRKTSGNSISS